MFNLRKNIEQINFFLLPLAAFFILISSAATNLFVFLCILFSAFICIKNRDVKKLIEKKVFIFSSILFLLFLFSSLYSIAEFQQIYESIKKYIKFMYIPLIYYSISIYNNNETIIKFFITGCTIVLLMSYLKFFSIINFELFYYLFADLNLAGYEHKIVINKTAIFQHYIIQGVILSLYSFLCLFSAYKKGNFIYYILSFLSFINVLFMNDSRTAFILIASLFVLSFFFIIKNIKPRIVVFIIILLMSFSQLSENLENRLSVLSTDMRLMENNNYNTSLGLRTLWLRVGIENLSKKPILGYGVGSFNKTSEKYFIDHNINPYDKYITNNPHNEFISISTQLGLLGLSFFILFLFYLFKESTGNILNVGIFLTVIISTLFNSAFYDNMLGLFLIIIIGLLLDNKQKFQKL